MHTDSEMGVPATEGPRSPKQPAWDVGALTVHRLAGRAVLDAASDPPPVLPSTWRSWPPRPGVGCGER